MTPKIDLVNVKVSVNGKDQVIKMERGTSFENKGGIFTAGENNGVLKMTNYQLQAFKAMANNYTEEGENGIVLSKKDIQEAQNKYKNGEFVADMSEFLPEGYKIERSKLTSAKNMVQAYVTNGKESQSATLKFSFKDLFDKQSQEISPQNNEKVVNIRDLKNCENKVIGIDNGKLVFDDCGTGGWERVPFVENGKVKLEYDNAQVLLTYKDGKLLKYERDVSKSPRNSSLYVNEGDFQHVEFYSNGNIKKLDINIIQYGEAEGARFICNCNDKGEFISGKHKDDGNSWTKMEKEDFDFYTQNYPTIGAK